MNLLKWYFFKLKVLLGIEHYGFTKLTYRGLPIILKDDFPNNEIGFFNENTGKMKMLNIKTGKVMKVDSRRFGMCKKII
jgi:hypothetical protein